MNYQKSRWPFELKSKDKDKKNIADSQYLIKSIEMPGPGAYNPFKA